MGKLLLFLLESLLEVFLGLVPRSGDLSEAARGSIHNWKERTSLLGLLYSYPLLQMKESINYLRVTPRQETPMVQGCSGNKPQIRGYCVLRPIPGTVRTLSNSIFTIFLGRGSSGECYRGGNECAGSKAAVLPSALLH